jgi:FMN phosphatase YigB (HAD superfamily)
MSRITHVFFDLHGTLVDAVVRLPPLYRAALGRYMAGRYGGDPAEWAEANRRVVEDWDSYYADLDLSGEDSLEQMWEGQTRTLRALFRLTGRPYPPPDEMTWLVHAHHYAVTSQCDGLYPEVYGVLQAVHAMPLTLGVISQAVTGHAGGLLVGAGVREWFTGPIITPDVAGYFGKDAGYFRLAFAGAEAAPQQCVVVDDDPDTLRIAAALGARAVLIDRAGLYADGETVILPDLGRLPEVLRGWLADEEPNDHDRD